MNRERESGERWAGAERQGEGLPRLRVRPVCYGIPDHNHRSDGVIHQRSMPTQSPRASRRTSFNAAEARVIRAITAPAGPVVRDSIDFEVVRSDSLPVTYPIDHAVYAADSIVKRFVLFHCHMLFHQDNGMMANVLLGPPGPRHAHQH
jgi:hypothetical protein